MELNVNGMVVIFFKLLRKATKNTMFIFHRGVGSQLFGACATRQQAPLLLLHVVQTCSPIERDGNAMVLI